MSVIKLIVYCVSMSCVCVYISFTAYAIITMLFCTFWRTDIPGFTPESYRKNSKYFNIFWFSTVPIVVINLILNFEVKFNGF